MVSEVCKVLSTYYADVTTRSMASFPAQQLWGGTFLALFFRKLRTHWLVRVHVPVTPKRMPKHQAGSQSLPQL